MSIAWRWNKLGDGFSCTDLLAADTELQELERTQVGQKTNNFLGHGKTSIGVVLMTLISGTVWAVGETDTGTLGNTTLQKATGDSVEFTCVSLANAGLQSTPLGQSCTKMVQTGEDINDPTGEGPRALSLALSQDEFAAALQQIATEEFAATETMANELASNRVPTFLTRLFELRRGVRGFNIAGLSPDQKRTLAAEGHWLDPGDGQSGGAAGVDTWENLGAFLNISYGTGDRDDTDRTDEFDFDSYGFTLGVDYRFTDNLVLGVALAYVDVDSDFDKKATVNGGDIDADGWGGFLYGTYYIDQFYLDGLIGYAKTDYDIRRKIFIPSNNNSVAPINDTAKASPDSDDYTVSLGGGYDFKKDALTYGPYARVTYLNVDVDDYREKGAEASGLNLAVDGEKWESLTTALGGRISYAMNQRFGVLIPQARAAWVHEFENDSQTIKARYLDTPASLFASNQVLRARTDEPDEDYFELGVAISAVLKGGLQAFFSYDTLLGLDDVTDHLFTAGARWEF